MVPFAGYEMPVRYTTDTDEHLCVRQRAGMFDVSHMGEFRVTGPNALTFLQQVTSNNVAALSPGKIQYSCLPTPEGGIVDDLLVYCMGPEDYFLVVNAANIDTDFAHLQKYIPLNGGVTLENHSEEYALFALQGPKAIEVLQPLTDLDLSQMTYYTFGIGELAGHQNILISATGYTGAGGFEIYVHPSIAVEIWTKLLEKGKAHGLQPIGLGARDTLRLEMGFCLYGNDIDLTTSPLEAGLGWITKFSKDFNGKEFLMKQKADGLKRKLSGFKMLERGIPRNGYPIFNEAGEEIGKVTSGTQSPSLQEAIGLGYVASDFSTAGSIIYIGIRDKKLKAEVVSLPFYKNQ